MMTFVVHLAVEGGRKSVKVTAKTADAARLKALTDNAPCQVIKVKVDRT
jgi:hypothetical protein